jgi:hypothetical protein
MIITYRYKKTVFNVASTRTTESFSVKNKAQVHFEKFPFGSKTLCSTVTLYIVPIVVVQHEISSNSCKLAIY